MRRSTTQLNEAAAGTRGVCKPMDGAIRVPSLLLFVMHVLHESRRAGRHPPMPRARGCFDGSHRSDDGNHHVRRRLASSSNRLGSCVWQPWCVHVCVRAFVLSNWRGVCTCSCGGKTKILKILPDNIRFRPKVPSEYLFRNG